MSQRNTAGGVSLGAVIAASVAVLCLLLGTAGAQEVAAPAAGNGNQTPAPAANGGQAGAAAVPAGAAAAEQAAPDLGVPAAAAQPAPPRVVRSYTKLPVDESQKKETLKISGWLRNGIPAGQETAFDAYYKTYALPRWTHETFLAGQPEGERQIDVRRELRRDFFTARGAAHERLTSLALLALPVLARDPKYHPATRYNAMLAIGELNQIEPQGATPPVPLAKALPLLVEAVSNAEQPDAVKIAALIGINRHAKLNIANAQKQGIADRMLEIAKEKDPPEGRTPEGHAWMRALAIDTLGALGLPGNQNAVVTTMASIVGDESENMSTRAAAARALGTINYTGLKGVQANALLGVLARFGATACADELAKYQKAKDQAQDKKAGGMYGGGYGMESMYSGAESTPDMYSSEMMMSGYGAEMGYGMAKKKEPELLSRRRLKTNLYALRLGVNGADDKQGVKTLAGGDENEAVKKLNAVIKKLNDALDGKDLEEADRVKGVTDSQAEFLALAQAYAPSPATPSPAPAAAPAAPAPAGQATPAAAATAPAAPAAQAPPAAASAATAPAKG
ncbi:MAG: hypothetical protein KJZ87_02790 [Thermoguttaceae bacterium]|nr:hypothetical protein [Thermoguttaceae bacterium]